MFNSSSKVHPEQAVPETEELMEEDDDEVQILEVKMASVGTASAVPGSSKGVGVVRSSKLAGVQRRLLEWDEIVEDLDIAIENTKTKSALYRLNGEPLKRKMPKAKKCLADITEQIMASFGLEFLGTISEVLVAGDELNIGLPDILDQMQNLKLKKDSTGGEKLIIWIDDDPQENKKSSSFSHMLITELMRDDVEPEMVLPCHDIDESILLSLVDQVENRLSLEQRRSYAPDQADFGKVVISQLLRIGVTLSLASVAARIVIIDSDSFIREEPQLRLLMDEADKNGHTVMFFRDTAAVTDKAEEVQKFREMVRAWHTVSTKRDTTLPTDFMILDMTEDEDEVETKRKIDAAANKALIEQDVGSYYDDDPSTVE